MYYDGETLEEMPGRRHADGAAHGSGCTHSSALAAHLALGHSPLEAARAAKVIASEAVRDGLRDLGAGAGPVDVFGLARRVAQPSAGAAAAAGPPDRPDRLTYPPRSGRRNSALQRRAAGSPDRGISSIRTGSRPPAANASISPRVRGQGGPSTGSPLVAGGGDDEEGPARRDQARDVGDGHRARRIGQGLRGQALDDEVEGALPAVGRVQEVGDEVVDGRVGVAAAGGADGGGGDVEGDGVEPEAGDELGVVAEAAADDHSAQARCVGAVLPRPLDEQPVWGAAVPRHDGVALLGGGVEALEPAGDVPVGERLRRQARRVLVFRVRSCHRPRRRGVSGAGRGRVTCLVGGEWIDGVGRLVGWRGGPADGELTPAGPAEAPRPVTDASATRISRRRAAAHTQTAPPRAPAPAAPVHCSSRPARMRRSIYARSRASRIVDSIPARRSSSPSVSPAGPAPTMATGVRLRSICADLRTNPGRLQERERAACSCAAYDPLAAVPPEPRPLA